MEHTLKTCIAESKDIELLKDVLEDVRFLQADSVFMSQATLPPDEFYVCYVDENYLNHHKEKISRWLETSGILNFRMLVRSSGSKGTVSIAPIPEDLLYYFLPETLEPPFLKKIFLNIFSMLALRLDHLKLQTHLELSHQEIRHLTRVGQLLATEKNFDTLIALILEQAQALVNADGGSIYIVERESGKNPVSLRFKKSALNLNADEFLLPINKNSLAGYAALTGELINIDHVYQLTDNEPFRFNYEFDKTHNYYTKSVLTIPMKNHAHHVIGVIQLINRKKKFDQVLTLDEMKGDAVIPFDEKNIELARALAGQAAVAVENNQLLNDINSLFEGFVKASVTAIEQRDPTTSGHSFRVAAYTMSLAKCIDQLNTGVFADIRFTSEQIRELRYAALLHDFGKVGVRERVLVKEKKLYKEELEIVESRFRYFQKSAEVKCLKDKLAYLQQHGNLDNKSFFEKCDHHLKHEVAYFDKIMEMIRRANEPHRLSSEDLTLLQESANETFTTDTGESVPILSKNEFLQLAVERGSLDAKEREEIEFHVTHTYRFLVQIPWTRDLSSVPDIAYAHHEKLNGSGYPRGLGCEEIPLQSRIITIADIYDALTAPDRPYKRQMNKEEALNILTLESREGKVDPDIFHVFVENKIFENGASE